MKLVELKCKNCGAKLEINDSKMEAKCQYCHTTFKLDDEGSNIQDKKVKQDVSEDVTTPTPQKKNKSFWFYFFCLCFFPFVITYYVIVSNKLDFKKKIIILAIFWGIMAIIGITSSIEEKELEKNPWIAKCTDINDFDYYLEKDEILIKKYKGTDKQINVCSNYKIDGKDYTVTKFVDSVFKFGDSISIILPESLKSMPENTFYGSDARYIYIPASLEPVDENYKFYKNFDDVIKLYYGGTEEQWKTLTNNVDRTKIDAKEIKYDVDIKSMIEKKN